MPPMKRPIPQDKNHFGETLSLNQLAQRWNLSNKAVRSLLGQGHIAFEQICGVLRVPRAEVERAERERTKT